MKRSSLIIAVILLIMTVSLVIVTMGYPLRSKLFPLIALGTALVLLIVQVFREVSALNRQETPSGKGTVKRPPARRWVIWAWLAGTLVMLWMIGFMGTVVLLPFLYLRFNKESWFISVTLPLGCGVFFYVLFGLALDMPLYPGIVYPRFLE